MYSRQLCLSPLTKSKWNMLGILIAAALLGIIISVMEEGDFPGWGPMIICVLAAIAPAAIINLFLPPGLGLIGLFLGALSGGFAISATCGMSVKRSCIAASIFFGCQIVLSLIF